MKGFFRLMTSAQVRKILRGFPVLPAERVPIGQALGRTAASDIACPEDLPPFSRSTMDGYAVKARDVFGASESEPALLNVAGEVRMGSQAPAGGIGPGEACRIWTGGMLPGGADAVVMVEYTKEIEPGLIEVYRAVAPGENVILQGEDCTEGSVCITCGTKLRPQELGLLAGVGVTEVQVVRRPKVFILSTGDEIVPEYERPASGKVRDMNSTTLSALVTASGGSAHRLGIVPDSKEAILDKCEQALDQGADIVLVSGGSSVGARDYTLAVFERICKAPPLVHGVAIRPGKPTIIARSGDRALFGLPGHVASCIVVYLLFVHYLVKVMSGADPDTGLERKRAVCAEMFPSAIGREEYVRVRLERDADSGRLLARPIYGKSGLISTLVSADALVKIPRDSEGYHQGEEAEVMLLP